MDPLPCANASLGGPEMILNMEPLPDRMTVLGCSIYFNRWAPAPASRYELWVTTGRDFEARFLGQDLLVPWEALGDLLLFSRWQIGRTDGTEAGTFNLTQHRFTEERDGVALGGTFLFASGDPDYKQGVELWRTDGTREGTSLLKELLPGNAPQKKGPFGFTYHKGHALFWSDDEAGGGALWKSDGTAEGTIKLRDVTRTLDTPDTLASKNGKPATVVGDNVYFLGAGPASGFGIWRTDGTASGTELLTRLDAPAPGRASLFRADDIYEMAAFDGHAYVYAQRHCNNFEGAVACWSPPYDTLIRTDGTKEGTEVVLEISRTATPSSRANFIATDKALYFWRDQVLVTDAGRSNRYALFRTDGTAAGTYEVTLGGLTSTEPGRTIYSPIQFRGLLYFAGLTPDTGFELWKTDGTPNGAELVKDIHPGPTGSDPENMTLIGETLYFAADDGVHGIEVWATDGTSENTRLLADINTNGNASPLGFIKFGDAVAFVATDGTHTGRQLWRIRR